MDILFFIGDLIVNPVSIYAARSTIATLIVSLLPSDKNEKKKTSDIERRK